MSNASRFWSKVEFTDTCWLWKKGKNRGYGQFYFKGKNIRAHRWAYEFCIGKIPGELTLDHLCRIHACVRPDHLEPVTPKENTQRGNSGKIERDKTHCLKGHPFNKSNTYHYKEERHCRTCGRIRSRKMRARKKMTA